MSPHLLVPLGRWKVHAESTSEQATIRLSGRALADSSTPAREHGFVLTPAQAQELIAGLNLALLEVELQRTANLARAAEGAG
ncbi:MULTISPECIES: hypothetical protein [Paraburkholderia]|uniref:hypothetical protein n=1 Tax=Paraburkholderia TaxID=1822464 RepID=UPI00036E94D3|nr:MULTISPECIES: hypothetical protein [Paraburkholderia]MDH6147177.1 hypothetical protein [Paraburkholderia sp. WSM4179]